jgi:hypothetical protein
MQMALDRRSALSYLAICAIQERGLRGLRDMDPLERLRAVILSTVARDLPKGFWADIREGARRTYADVFQQVRSEPALLENQRIDLLYQLRHCRMEYLLMATAEKYGVACSPNVLEKNGRYYVYASNGAVGMTQSYVQTIGAMPKPAKYLERHAAMNAIPRSPQLMLGDVPPEVFLGRDFYGLLAHNPLGKRFTEADQHLGMMQFCVPVQDYSQWAAELTIAEILGAYESDAPSAKPDRALPWKDRGEEKKDDGK